MPATVKAIPACPVRLEEDGSARTASPGDPAGGGLAEASPKPRKARARRSPRRVLRRGTPTPEALRHLDAEDLWSRPSADAALFARDELSRQGANTSKPKSSARGFDCAVWLAAEFFGDEPLGSITTAEAEDFVAAIGELPERHGKRQEYCRPIGDLIQYVKDTDDRALRIAEERAEAEGWSDERLLGEADAMRVARIAPGTNHGHPSRVARVRTTVTKASTTGEPPMVATIWSKKSRDAPITARSRRRSAWGEEGRRRLFSRPLFVEGPEHVDEPLYWLPLIERYAGLRMEEACQPGPGNVGVREGVPVFDVDFGED